MILRKLSVDGFKGFGTAFSVEFTAGLNVLVGENGTGKSAVVDAIRTILQEDEFGRAGIRDTDFYRPFDENAESSDQILISASFFDLSADEQIAFLPWTDGDEAKLSLQVQDTQSTRKRFKRLMWGGVSSNSIFEWDLMNTINCVYLPPLRDAEARLCEGRGSRLGRLMRILCAPELKKAEAEKKLHPLENTVNEFNKKLTEEATGPIAKTNELIRDSLRKAVGDVFGQDTRIRFSEASFSRIVESLRLLFFPKIGSTVPAEAFRGLEENSLGYNNLLYLATVLAELTQPATGELEYLKLLLIEEPEAHLHPQLQMRLLKFIENKAQETGIQVIVTTHSPALASAVSLDSVIHLSACYEGKPKATPLSQCGVAPASSLFISRWLDATKSVLLFAKSVILVEGIAEALLLPAIAKRVLKADLESKLYKGPAKTLEDAGVSVINMNGIYFSHFMQLFCNIDGANADNLPVRCSGITDNDPPPDAKPTPSNLVNGNNPALQLLDPVNKSDGCRLFVSALKTFEYDLAMEGANRELMAEVLADLWPSDKGPVCLELADTKNPNWRGVSSDAAFRLLELIESSSIGKGFFAQALAARIESDASLHFSVPEYIRSAIRWVVGIPDGED